MAGIIGRYGDLVNSNPIPKEISTILTEKIPLLDKNLLDIIGAPKGIQLIVNPDQFKGKTIQQINDKTGEQGLDILDLRVPRDNHSLHPLEDFLKREQIKRSYLPVAIPHIAVVDLFKTSGHWQKYKENMFPMMAEDGAGAQLVNSFGKSLNVVDVYC